MEIKILEISSTPAYDKTIVQTYSIWGEERKMLNTVPNWGRDIYTEFLFSEKSEGIDDLVTLLKGENINVSIVQPCFITSAPRPFILSLVSSDVEQSTKDVRLIKEFFNYETQITC